MIKVVPDFISKEDVKVVNDYMRTVKFHTKDEHVPLHNNLFNSGAPFDIHTRGEMPDNVLNIFSKYSYEYWRLVSSLEDVPYHPPMFSKHYIARYREDSIDNPHYADRRPEGTYGSYIYWNTDFDGGEILFEKDSQQFLPEPGTLIFFKEVKENSRHIKPVTSGYLFLSEAWMAPVGVCPDPNVEYDSVFWDDINIKGFDEQPNKTD